MPFLLKTTTKLQKTTTNDLKKNMIETKQGNVYHLFELLFDTIPQLLTNHPQRDIHEHTKNKHIQRMDAKLLTIIMIKELFQINNKTKQ